MPIRAYRWSVMLPTLVLAVPLFVIGLAAGSFPVYAMGVFLFVGGAGDVWIMWTIRRCGGNTTVMDHPAKPGCVVYIDEK